MRPHALLLGCTVPKTALVSIMEGETPFFQKNVLTLQFHVLCLLCSILKCYFWGLPV